MNCVLQANFLVVLDLNELAISLLKNSLIALCCIKFLQFFVNFTLLTFLVLLFALLFNLLFCKHFFPCLNCLRF